MKADGHVFRLSANRVWLDGSDGPVERMKFKMLEDTPDLMSDKLWFSESSEVWK